MTNPVEILNGALEGRYLVEREIGSGGMATVYLAEDIRHKRKVAVKVLRPELASILGADRFLREVEIAAQLQHPHILTLIDSGAADGILYYVMPFIEGESLRGKLEREKELPVGDAVRIVREIVDALVKAHATGVVHRDIKPDNILLSGRHAIVTDFGIAKALSEATGGRNVTETGMALGTPTYMAPEQAVADPNVDHRADIYAVGVLAYEMLTGTPPFGGANVQAVLSAHVTQTPKAVTETRPTVPAQLGALVMKCLEKRPADRWQTAEELHAELERYATPSEGTVPVEPASKKRPVLKALAEAGVIIAVALAGVFFFNRSDENATVIQSGDRLAVIPFAPTSEDSSLSRLGRDLVVLLTRNLDGVGDIEVVDHTTVLAKTGDENRRYSLAEAAEMGRDLGAATILHGSLVRVSDQVVLDVGLFETDGLAELARVSTQAPLDDHFFLTDETTWALLEAIWRTGEAPTPSVGAITTRSWPALRAFLDGEDAIAKGEWTKAVGLYSEAIEADTLFWMAHLRHRIASGWTFGEDPTTAFAKPLSVIQQHLPPRERLQVQAQLASSTPEVFRIGDELVERYPNYIPGLLDHADRLIHSGPLFGRNIREARPLLERILSVDSDFLPAYEHLAYVAVRTNDEELLRSSIDALILYGSEVTGYYGPTLQLSTFVNSVLNVSLAYMEEPDRYKSNISEVQIDSILTDLRHVGEGAGFPIALMYEGFVPPNDWGIGVANHLIDETDLTVRRLGYNLLNSRWAARGAWDSAAASMQNYATNFDDPETRITQYRIAVYGAWLGALNDSIPENLRAGLADLESGSNPASAELHFLDGLLAASREDRSALGAAVQRLTRLGGEEDTDLYRSTLSAFQLALDGDIEQAGTKLAEQERNGSLSTLRPVARLAAAQWLVQANRTGEAETMLNWYEALPSSEVTHAYNRIFTAPASFERARVAEIEGRREDAVNFYSQFLNLYDMPTEKHLRLRDEAQEALARLTTEGTRP